MARIRWDMFNPDARLDPTQVEDRRVPDPDPWVNVYRAQRLPKAFEDPSTLPPSRRWMGGGAPQPFAWDRRNINPYGDGTPIYKAATKTVGGRGNRRYAPPPPAPTFAERQAAFRADTNRNRLRMAQSLTRNPRHEDPSDGARVLMEALMRRRALDIIQAAQRRSVAASKLRGMY